jgi:polysaccharide biosynthesis/export protein
MCWKVLRVWPRVFTAVSLLTLSGGCGYPRATPEAAEIQVQSIPLDRSPLYTYAERETTYTVGPFDRLLLAIWRYEDLSKEILVKEDGTVFIPENGHVSLAGMTLREAQERLTEAFQSFIRNPQIDLSPVEIRSKRYYIMGEVRQPGGYPIFKPITVREAVSIASGSSEFSMLDGAYLSRKGQVYPVDLTSMFTAAQQDIYMLPNDILYIPSQRNAMVYVIGEVARPGAYPIQGHGINLIQSIAQAGGYTLSAKEREVAVIRRHGDEMTLHVVNIEKALRYGKGDPRIFAIRHGDIIWVPPSGIANWNRGLALITPTLDTFLFKPLTGARDYFLIQDILQRGR